MHIADKKWELIKRDPLGREMDSLFKQWLQQRKAARLWERLGELRVKIRKKYCCNIYIPESTIQGLTDFWSISANPRISVKDARKGGTIIIRKDGKIRCYDWETDGSIYCPPHMIPIIADPTTLTLNDEKMIKQEVWDIIKKGIKKSTSSKGNWEPKAPEGEPQELARVLRLRSDTFKKYLSWYDLKIAGLPFRLIAFVTQTSSQEKRDEVFQELIKSKKRSRLGQAVRGESTVRNGFGLIYQAIYRQKVPTQETAIETQETYNCPEHGNACKGDCSYLHEWLSRFNASRRRF